jgi:sec-independent protein translocase protein TatA
VCAFFENIGFGELVLIFLAALVIFGPSKLPELGKSLGQGIREFKKATQAITEEVTKAAVEETSTASHDK